MRRWRARGSAASGAAADHLSAVLAMALGSVDFREVERQEKRNQLQQCVIAGPSKLGREGLRGDARGEGTQHGILVHHPELVGGPQPDVTSNLLARASVRRQFLAQEDFLLDAQGGGGLQ